MGCANARANVKIVKKKEPLEQPRATQIPTPSLVITSGIVVGVTLMVPILVVFFFSPSPHVRDGLVRSPLGRVHLHLVVNVDGCADDSGGDAVAEGAEGGRHQDDPSGVIHAGSSLPLSACVLYRY